MYRLEDIEAYESRDKYSCDFAHVRAEQELYRLADVVVNSSAFLDSGHNRREVIVGKHHIRNVFGDVRTCDAHSDTDIRGFYGGSVIYTVACHSCNVACCSPLVYDARLVLRLNSRVD